MATCQISTTTTQPLYITSSNFTKSDEKLNIFLVTAVTNYCSKLTETRDFNCKIQLSVPEHLRGGERK